MPDIKKDQPDHTTPLVDDEMVDFILEGEGHVPYLYRDTKGNPTVGGGFHIPNEKDALNYSFRRMKSEKEFGEPATPAEITDAYRKILKKPYGQTTPFTSFNPFSKDGDLVQIGVDEQYGRNKIKEKLTASQKMLESKIPGFSTLERPAQQALLDMEYNIGDKKFRPHYKDEKTGQIKPAWPKLFKAIDAKDWKAAAEEVESGDVQPNRNLWRKQKLLQAEKIRNDQGS